MRKKIFWVSLVIIVGIGLLLVAGNTGLLQGRINSIFSHIRNNDPCSPRSFTAASVLVVNDRQEATKERLKQLSQINNNAESAFAYATDYKASISISNTKILRANKSMTEQYNGDLYLVVNETAKAFYEDNKDKYDFLIVYESFDVANNMSNYLVKNNISGIGRSIFDSTDYYGSGGRLRAVAHMGYVDGFPAGDYISPARGIVHELGHTWCCAVGDAFQEGQNGAELEIRNNYSHLYAGLESTYDTSSPMRAQHWIPNPSITNTSKNMTYRLDDSASFTYKKYHPFVLYFMGLLSQKEYNTPIPIYNAGIDESNLENAELYGTVTVNDIINVEGVRGCTEQK